MTYDIDAEFRKLQGYDVNSLNRDSTLAFIHAKIEEAVGKAVQDFAERSVAIFNTVHCKSCSNKAQKLLKELSTAIQEDHE